MIPFAEHWRLSLGEAQQLQHAIMGYLPGFATPRIVCDVPFVGKRWVHQVAHLRHRARDLVLAKNYRTSIEAGDDEALSPRVRLLRPDLHAAPRPARPGGARATTWMPCTRRRWSVPVPATRHPAPTSPEPLPSGTPATVALTAAGVAFTQHTYEHDPTARSFGLEAAEVLGLPPEQVFKTLLVDTGAGLAVAVVPVTGQLDLKAMAAAVGGQAGRDGGPGCGRAVVGLRRRRHLAQSARSAPSPPSSTRARSCSTSSTCRAAGAGSTSGSPRRDLVRVTGATVADIGR